MPIVIAHRGASAIEPENSLAAFRVAVEMGADGVELDTHETADGALVVVHDPELDGVPIHDMPVEAVRDHLLANGEPVPTLEEALSTIGRDTTAFIEVKALSPAGDARLFELIDRAPAPDRCHVHSFDHRIVRRLCAARDDLKGGVLSASYPLDPAQQVHAAGAVALWQHRDLIDPSLAMRIHEAGYALFAWTVDRPDRMRELLALGVDGICSNTPDVAREVVG